MTSLSRITMALKSPRAVGQISPRKRLAWEVMKPPEASSEPEALKAPQPELEEIFT